MNFGFVRTLLLVILPQAWKVILPPGVAFMVMFIKDTVARLADGRRRAYLHRQDAHQSRLFALPCLRNRALPAISSCPIRSAASAPIWRTALPHLEADNLSSALWTGPGPVRSEPVGEQGRGRQPDRPVRLRQEHLPARADGAYAADGRRGAHRRRARSTIAREPSCGPRATAWRSSSSSTICSRTWT